LSDRVSSIWRWASPGRAKAGSGVGPGSGAGPEDDSGGGAAGSSAAAAGRARGRGGLAEVGRPGLRRGRGASPSVAGGGEVGRLAMRRAPGDVRIGRRGASPPFRPQSSWHMTAPDMNAPIRKFSAVAAAGLAAAGLTACAGAFDPRTDAASPVAANVDALVEANREYPRWADFLKAAEPGPEPALIAARVAGLN